MKPKFSFSRSASGKSPITSTPTIIFTITGLSSPRFRRWRRDGRSRFGGVEFFNFRNMLDKPRGLKPRITSLGTSKFTSFGSSNRFWALSEIFRKEPVKSSATPVFVTGSSAKSAHFRMSGRKNSSFFLACGYERKFQPSESTSFDSAKFNLLTY